MDFNFKEINDLYLNEIYDLQMSVFQEGYDESLLRYNSKEMLKEVLIKNSYTLGVFHNGQLIAIGILQYYQALLKDAELNILLKNKKFDRYFTVKLIIVKKGYRGFGLQRRMLDKMVEHIIQNIERDKKILFLATVSPKNKYSLNNFIACGYKILALKKMYGGYDRFLVYKEVKSESKIDKAISE